MQIVFLQCLLVEWMSCTCPTAQTLQRQCTHRHKPLWTSKCCWLGLNKWRFMVKNKSLRRLIVWKRKALEANACLHIALAMAKTENNLSHYLAKWYTCICTCTCASETCLAPELLSCIFFLTFACAHHAESWHGMAFCHIAPQTLCQGYRIERKCFHFLFWPCCFFWYHLLYPCLELNRFPPKNGDQHSEHPSVSTTPHTPKDAFVKSWGGVLHLLLLLHFGLWGSFHFGKGLFWGRSFHHSIQLFGLFLTDPLHGFFFILLKAFSLALIIVMAGFLCITFLMVCLMSRWRR